MSPQGQVISSSSLSPEISTPDIRVDDILNDFKNNSVEKVSSIKASQSDGYLSFAFSNEPSRNMVYSQVIKHLKMADDCHSYNVVLRSGNTPETIRLSTTRPIAEKKELSLWFAPEILAAIHMPFLTPVNIKGEKNYTCHKCNRTYEYPNPLKIHLSLNDCNMRISIENILRNLYKNMKLSLGEQCKPIKVGNAGRSHIYENAPVKTEIDTVVSISEPLNRLNTTTSHGVSRYENFADATSVRLRTSNHVTKNASAVAPTSCHQSAFKPYQNQQIVTGQRQYPVAGNKDMPDPYLRDSVSSSTYILNPDASGSPVFTPPHLSARPLYLVPMSSPDDNNVLQKSFRDEIDLLERRAVDMETFVSNLGKLKHGHLCLYCGKVYSRKYGLKIHIRTHTGFKPLKCKYCLRPFGDPSNLNKHVRLHAEGETPYRCELCHKVLVRRRDLERHMKSRHQTSCSTTDDEKKDENPL